MKRAAVFLTAFVFVISVFPKPGSVAAQPVFGQTVAAGYDHFLAVSDNGDLWAWGWNSFGQLGDGTTTERLYPVKIMEHVISVKASESYSAAITADGSLWLWGFGSYGQIGDGGGADRYKPVRILGNVVNAALFQDYVYAIRGDGSLWAWGRNSSAQLGTGDYEDRLKPVMISETADWNDVSARLAATESSHAEIRSGGSLWTWGDNTSGQLGNSTLESSSSAVKIIASGVAGVDMGPAQAIALRSDGSVLCWGGNGTGILGDGGTTGAIRPMPVSLKAAIPGSAYTGVIPDEISYASDWAKDHIRQALSRGLIPESLQSDYRTNITRSEFCIQAMLFLEIKTGYGLDRILEEKGISVDTSPFTDTEDKTVIAAYSLGIIAGRGNGIFDPSGEITREEAAVMLRNTAQALGYPITAPANTFPDKTSIALWALQAVDFVSDRGVMAGTGKGFDPASKYTREQADITFNQLFEALV